MGGAGGAGMGGRAGGVGLVGRGRDRVLGPSSLENSRHGIFVLYRLVRSLGTLLVEGLIKRYFARNDVDDICCFALQILATSQDFVAIHPAHLSP